jgi:fumarate hydratase subunit beta
MKIIKAPLSTQDAAQLKMGEEVLVEGVIYVARDAAHKKIVQAMAAGEKLPFELQGQLIYYAGPCPAPPGKVIGSVGPTTSGRMDAYAPLLIEKGLKGMIGKGPRDKGVINSMHKYGAVYLAAVGGAGAYLAKRILTAEIVAYPELGPEAILKLTVQDFPCIVAIDSQGNDIYNQPHESK